MYRTAGTLIVIGAMAKVLHYLYRKQQNRRDICEVLFTNPSSKCCVDSKPDDGKPCTNVYCIKRIATRIIDRIDAASNNICIAMNIFTYNPIYEALCRAKRRGVAVRVIIDNIMSNMTDSKSKSLEESHIDVRLFNGGTGRSMHHKFCLIDVDIESWFDNDKGILINGSMNWTNNAFTKNWENFIISSDAGACKQLQREFESLWLVAIHY